MTDSMSFARSLATRTKSVQSLQYALKIRLWDKPSRQIHVRKWPIKTPSSPRHARLSINFKFSENSLVFEQRTLKKRMMCWFVSKDRSETHASKSHELFAKNAQLSDHCAAGSVANVLTENPVTARWSCCWPTKKANLTFFFIKSLYRNVSTMSVMPANAGDECSKKPTRPCVTSLGSGTAM